MTRTTASVTLPTLLAALLASCGGADTPPGVDAAAPATLSKSALASDPVAPLVADDGSVMPSVPQAIPADPDARTQAGRYASPAQADQLERASPGMLVRVAVRGRGAAAIDEAARSVHDRLAALRLPATAPVLIDGADLPSAAALVDRLAAEGVANAWLVTL